MKSERLGDSFKRMLTLCYKLVELDHNYHAGVKFQEVITSPTVSYMYLFIFYAHTW